MELATRPMSVRCLQRLRALPANRRLQECARSSLATFGAFWLVIESLGAFIDSLQPAGWMPYGTLWAVAVARGVWTTWPRRQIELPIPGSDSLFTIRFGDVFDTDGPVVIPVNEYFSGELGDHVSETSLHGQFIKKVLAGQSKTFRDLTRTALADVTPEETGGERVCGRTARYAIGTVACVDLPDRRYLLAVLSHTDVRSLKAHASVLDLWTCLEGVWKNIRNWSGGHPVTIPLIGSGLSGVGLPPKHIIGIIITSFFYFTKVKKVADEVSLILPSQMDRQIDLNDIKRRWT